ncbi:hypothetical protein C8Q74DRAFT_1444048 [Fomes fomentarius]|nr:hypothetical protein C8Q74DRAFT_1444048 [Fomes fomentarius]
MPRATDTTPDSDVIVDDSLVDLIRYINPAPSTDAFVYNWTRINPTNDLVYNRSISGCLQSGCMALFTFHEEVEVANMQVWSSYSINGQNNVTHQSGSQGADRLLLYQSEEMPYAQYTLQIYVGHAEDDIPYYLDWIEYNTSSRVSPPPPTISLEATTGTSPPTSPTTVSVASDTSSLLSSYPSGTSFTSQHPLSNSIKPVVSQGVIAVIAVCGGAVMLGAFTAMYLTRRRWASQSSNVVPEAPDDHQDVFAPMLPATDPSPLYSAFPSADEHSSRLSTDDRTGGEGERERLLTASSPPSTQQHGLAPSHSHDDLLGLSHGRTSPYGPHAVIMGEKVTYLVLAGTTPMSASQETVRSVP